MTTTRNAYTATRSSDDGARPDATPEALVMSHAALVAGIVRRLRPELSPDEVIDAVHDVTLRVLRRGERLPDRADLPGYMATAARNHVRSQLRHVGVERRSQQALDAAADQPVEPEFETWPGDGARVRRWLAGATQEDRHLFRMLFEENKGRPAIAASMAWTDHATRTAIAAFFERVRGAIVGLRRRGSNGCA